MDIFLLKTKHNQEKTDQLSEAVESLNLDFTVIDEAYDYSVDWLRKMGVQKIPCVVAVNNNEIINQTDNAYSLATFRADSEALITE